MLARVSGRSRSCRWFRGDSRQSPRSERTAGQRAGRADHQRRIHIRHKQSRRLHSAFRQDGTAGLIIIVPNVVPTLQCGLFAASIQYLAEREPINSIIEVTLKGKVVKCIEFHLPSNNGHLRHSSLPFTKMQVALRSLRHEAEQRATNFRLCATHSCATQFAYCSRLFASRWSISGRKRSISALSDV